MVAKKREIVVGRGSSTKRKRAFAGPKPRPSQAATQSGGARTPLTMSSASGSSTVSVASALSTITSSLTPKVFPLVFDQVHFKTPFVQYFGHSYFD